MRTSITRDMYSFRGHVERNPFRDQQRGITRETSRTSLSRFESSLLRDVMRFQLKLLDRKGLKVRQISGESERGRERELPTRSRQTTRRLLKVCLTDRRDRKQCYPLSHFKRTYHNLGILGEHFTLNVSYATFLTSCLSCATCDFDIVHR